VSKRRVPPLDGEGLIVPVVFGANHVDIGVNPSLGGGARPADGLADLLRQGFGGRGQRAVAADQGGLMLLWARQRGGRGGDAADQEGGRGGGRREGWYEEEREEVPVEVEVVMVVRESELEGPYGHQIFGNRGKGGAGCLKDSHSPDLCLCLSLSLPFFFFFFLFFFFFFFNPVPFLI
jgi:hypothetical protein